MLRSIFLSLLITGSLSLPNCLAQSVAVPPSGASQSTAATKNRDTTGQVHYLVPLNTIKAAYMNAGMFLWPLKCDSSGNLYLRNLIDGVPGIHKINPEGKQVAVFQPDSATPDFKDVFSGYFSIAMDGYLYQWVDPREIRKHIVFVYKPDGSLKSYIKLETGFPWTPAQVAAFSSGNLLVTGLEYDRDLNDAKWPFTGVFSPSGALLKEVKLEDDDAIHDMTAAGDDHVAPPEAPGVNHAVGLGQMDPADDGNIYLMRRLSPAIVYAISPSGALIRRFAVDPGGSDYIPQSMHIAGTELPCNLTSRKVGISYKNCGFRRTRAYNLSRR